jgi:hypothetical protein
MMFRLQAQIKSDRELYLFIIVEPENLPAFCGKHVGAQDVCRFNM